MPKTRKSRSLLVTAPTASSDRHFLVSFEGGWNPTADEVAKIVRATLDQTFPAVKFTVRYRTTHTTRPSWVAVRWRDGPSEAEVEAVVQPPLQLYDQQREQRIKAARIRMGLPP
jgi:hypothetical protein